MYPIYLTSLVPLMTFYFPIIYTVDTLLKVHYARELLCVTSWVHPRKAGLRWVGLLRPGVGTEVGQETLQSNGDNNIHQLLRACCVLQSHWAVYAHYFMDSHNNLTNINHEHIHFSCENTKARKMNQPRSSVLFRLEINREVNGLFFTTAR